MALPPSSYPSSQGRRCGETWWAPVVVTGKLPGVDFGSQFDHTVEPVVRDQNLVLESGSNEADQTLLNAAVRQAVNETRSRLDASVAKHLRFTNRERRSIKWLLDHAVALVEGVDEIRSKWRERDWPLDWGDGYSPYVPRGRGASSGRGDDNLCVSHGSGELFRCPTNAEVMDREGDRNAIGRRYADALAHVFCAEYTLWTLRLFKRAANAYANLPPRPAEQGQGAGGFVAPSKPVDPCKEFGVGCPPEREPDCVAGLCVDPDDLPDPNELPDEGLGSVTPTPPVPKPKSRTPYYLIGGGGVLLATAVAFFAIDR